MKKPVFWEGHRPTSLPRIRGVHLVAFGAVVAAMFALAESFTGTMLGLTTVVLGFVADNGGRA